MLSRATQNGVLATCGPRACSRTTLESRIKTLYFILLGKWQLQNGRNKPCVHLMDFVCLVHKICRYCYYKKWVYDNVQVIRSTARRYFRGWQHGPAWKCIYPKNRPANNARNHGNLRELLNCTKELQIPRKDCNAICSSEECRKGFNFCWKSKAIAEPKSAAQKISFRGDTTDKRSILSRFSDERPNRTHLCGAPKTKMA